MKVYIDNIDNIYILQYSKKAGDIMRIPAKLLYRYIWQKIAKIPKTQKMPKTQNHRRQIITAVLIVRKKEKTPSGSADEY